MNKEAIRDIADALNQLREACERHHVPAPDILSWSDREEGRAARLALNSVANISELMMFRYGPLHGPDDDIIGFKLKYGGFPS